jgi:riboflavin biosynthesis pyrimidine reductase
VPATHRVFADDLAPTLLVAAEDGPDRHGLAGVLRGAARGATGSTCRRCCAGSPRGGLRRIFVEGGGQTVSSFLAAGCLDRIHLTVAPVLLGSGRPAFTLPEAARISDGLRFGWTCRQLGEDLLLDVALHRARPGVCWP